MLKNKSYYFYYINTISVVLTHVLWQLALLGDLKTILLHIHFLVVGGVACHLGVHGGGCNVPSYGMGRSTEVAIVRQGGSEWQRLLQELSWSGGPQTTVSMMVDIAAAAPHRPPRWQCFWWRRHAVIIPPWSSLPRSCRQSSSVVVTRWCASRSQWQRWWEWWGQQGRGQGQRQRSMLMTLVCSTSSDNNVLARQSSAALDPLESS